MVTNNTEVLPKGLIKKIDNLKRRERSHYIRPVTHTDKVKTWMTWERTELLPSDLEGRAYYESKGFRLDPPIGTEWAKQIPVPEDTEKKQLKDEIAKQLERQTQLETELKLQQEQIKQLMEGAHSEQKGKRRYRRKKEV